MTIYEIFDKYATRQGWNDSSKLGIALSFIAENSDPSVWEEHLKNLVVDEDPAFCPDSEDGHHVKAECEPMCINCGHTEIE